MNEIIFWTGIWPNGISRPIGVYQLSYWLQQNKVESQVIDFCQWMTGEEIARITNRFITSKTKYIGISSGFWSDDNVPKSILDAWQFIKECHPRLKIIIGGQRANNNLYSTIADYVLVGEAENSLLQILKGNNLFVKFDITKSNHRFSEKDCIIDGEVLPLELGRGCVFRCKFCGHHNLGKAKHTYQRDIRLIEQEIIYNYEKFKTTHYHFLDDTVNEDREKITNLSHVPKNTGIDIKWNGYLRADLLWRFPETAEQLFTSGMRGCFFGIESLHVGASQTIGKGWSGKHARKFIPTLYKDIWNSEINLWCNFIIGLPGESESDLRSTLDWCLSNPVGYHRFVALNLYNYRTDTGSKSEFSENYKKYDYELDENGHWISQNFNYLTAGKLADDFNNRLSVVNRISSWTLFDLKNCNVDIEIGKSFPISQKRLYTKNFFIFLNRYKDKLMNL